MKKPVQKGRRAPEKGKKRLTVELRKWRNECYADWKSRRRLPNKSDNQAKLIQSPRKRSRTPSGTPSRHKSPTSLAPK